MNPVEVPAALRRAALEAWGEDGRRWLEALPATVGDVARRWRVTVGAPVGPLSYHWVVAARRDDGTEAVLKLGPPGPGHLDAEAATLRAFDGRGAVRLLEHDAEAGALLLERAVPGTPLTALAGTDDDAATRALVATMRRLHREPPPGCALPDVATYREDFAAHLAAGRGGGVLPDAWVVRAAALLDALCASATARVVLHGDLHHDNVVAAGREPWLAIDPHGVVGDPGSEVGSLLHNPSPLARAPRVVERLGRRVDLLADGLGLPRDRVVAWGFVKAVLSEVWTCEADGTTPGTSALDVAAALEPHLP